MERGRETKLTGRTRVPVTKKRKGAPADCTSLKGTRLLRITQRWLRSAGLGGEAAAYEVKRDGARRVGPAGPDLGGISNGKQISKFN
jgi:hypothetical protein